MSASPTTEAADTSAPDVRPAGTAPWSRPAEDVVTELEVDLDAGLDDAAVDERRRRYGRNEVEREDEGTLWELVANQFLEPIVGLLVAAGIAAALAGEIVEAIAVVVAVVVNAVIGFTTEYQARRSVESLRELGRTTANVRRGGSVREVDGAELVPGDVVLLEEGDLIPADLRLIEVANLQVDEAPLTGESEPVDKSVEPDDENTPLAERTAMVWKGTSVTVGSGAGVVTGIGADTQIGEVSTLVEAASTDEDTPLEEQLDGLGRALIGAVVAVGVVVAGLGIAVGQPVQEMVEVAIALAVAAVPEGLPVVATLALARGVLRMSRRNALVKRLASVETLGSAGIIFTDKTGTLTEGRMQARRLLLPGDRIVDLAEVGEDDRSDVNEALVVAALCGNATLGEDGPESDVGDPMETALQRAAVRAGLGDRDELAARASERREVAFDRDTKMMATIHELPDAEGFPDEGGLLVAVKGAPEAVLAACTTELGGGELDDDRRADWIASNERAAGEGMRLLALARKVVDDGDEDLDPSGRAAPDSATGQDDGRVAAEDRIADIDPYTDLELLGVVGLIDPPRQATKEAIAACHRAGVEVVMVTGDQPATAAAIAREIGLVEDTDEDLQVVRGADIPPVEEWDDETRDWLGATRVFARLAPAQKLDLIELAQERGAVVGMTGDGVNDAPALTKADIGIAMGDQGTQVARDAADIILQDDAFETIVEAIREGRTIFENIKRFVVYLLSGNLGEILAVTAAAVTGSALPLLPLQILFINLASDVFPAAALGLVEGDDAVLDDPPREPGTPIMGRTRWVETGLWSVLIGGTTLATFALALGPFGFDETQAVTVSFMAFVIARLVHVFNMRDPRQSVLTNPIARSTVVWAALGTSFALLLAGLYVGPLASVLGVAAPTAGMWALALGGSLTVLVVGQLALAFVGARRARASA